ncbi:MAG: phosphate ABC transporter permease subunit PstC [Lachnospiraceae bacterium]|nr:phosphate ABC transporter permease subunit PstC [Lachnospiraceae bacterium]
MKYLYGAGRNAGRFLITAAAFMTALLLGFIILFIVKESLPLFQEISLWEFLSGDVWKPISFTKTPPSFGIRNLILSTLYVSLLATGIALLISIGTALWLSCAAGPVVRMVMYALIDLLAGIPSVVYGFAGLMLLVRWFQAAGQTSGESVLTAALVLAVMLLPYMISLCSDAMLRIKERYFPAARSLGVDKWYIAASLILPLAGKSILLSMVLALGRAMGETMAVMMVIGNSNVFPTLLGKGETIAAAIALEMGTAVQGSTHYHALFAMGLVLIVLLCLIQAVITVIKERLFIQLGIRERSD